jgi:hypothetical protein
MRQAGLTRFDAGAPPSTSGRVPPVPISTSGDRPDDSTPVIEAHYLCHGNTVPSQNKIRSLIRPPHSPAIGERPSPALLDAW